MNYLMIDIISVSYKFCDDFNFFDNLKWLIDCVLLEVPLEIFSSPRDIIIADEIFIISYHLHI